MTDTFKIIDRMLGLTAEIADELLLLKDAEATFIPDRLKLKIISLAELASQTASGTALETAPAVEAAAPIVEEPDETPEAEHAIEETAGHETCADEAAGDAELAESTEFEAEESADNSSSEQQPEQPELPEQFEQPEQSEQPEPSEQQETDQPQEVQNEVLEQEAAEFEESEDAYDDDAEEMELEIVQDDEEEDYPQHTEDYPQSAEDYTQHIEDFYPSSPAPEAQQKPESYEVPESPEVPEPHYIPEPQEVPAPQAVPEAPLTPTVPVSVLRGAFSINDAFLFRRSIFGGSKPEFDTSLEVISHLANVGELRQYLTEGLGLNLEENPGKDFYDILSRYFPL